MFNLLVRVLIPVLTATILGALMVRIQKNNSQKLIESLHKQHVIVKLPPVYFWVGCITVIVMTLFILAMFCFPNDSVTIWTYVAFGVFDFLGVLLVIAVLLWRIDVFKDKPYFSYRTIFGKTYTVLYSDCISCEDKTNGYVLRTHTKKIVLDMNAENIEVLLAMLTPYCSWKS